MTTPLRVSGPASSLGLALLAAVWLLSACVSQRPVERRDAAVSTEQADVDRRARVRLELASAYFGRGQSATALEEVKLALAARPDLPEAHNLRGLIHASLNEPALAEDSFRRALALNGRDADTMHNYGWFLCQQRRFKEAEAQFQAAVAQPAYADAARSLMALGVCQARNLQWEAAEKSLSRAYELDPTNPATAVNLADVLYRRGEWERARFYIRRVSSQEQQVNAQTLWLALRIEHKLGQEAQVRVLGAQLRQRFPQAPETLLYDKGRFDE